MEIKIMLKSFRFWCFAAAAISLFTAALHVLVGGPEFHQPALDSALPDQWKAAFSTIWHAITALLLLSGIFLMLAALSLRKNLLMIWLVLSLNIAFAVLCISYGLVRLGTPWVLLQWTIFLCISGCVAAALWLRDKLAVVEEVASRPDHFAVLPAATFADTYIVHSAKFSSAIDAARGAFGKAPRWISTLMLLRNTLVKPFGLIHAPPVPRPNSIGMFPILKVTQDNVVLGLNDKHLDFRVVVELLNGGESVSLTTLVKPHHVFGKAYLAIIMPFHRIIAATILAQAVRNSANPERWS
jgi:Protein of unknown function (DUF2867)